MSTWLPAVLPTAVAALVLLVPGLLVGRAAGLRGAIWWGAAVPLTTTASALAAVLAGALGVRWSVPVLLVAALLGTAAARFLGLWVRRGPGPKAPAVAAPLRAPLVTARSAPHRPEPGRRSAATAVLTRPAPARALETARPTRRDALRRRRPTRPELVVVLATLGGLGVGCAVALRRLLRALGDPTHVSQSFDAVFHLNAVRRVVDTGDASSLTLGRVNAPGTALEFYPAAWHGLVALVVDATGAGVDVASNATAIAIAVLCWPLALLALVRALVGGRRAPALPLALAGVVPVAFVVAPQLQLEWGVLYPLLLAHLAVPVALALLVRGLDPALAPRERLAGLVVLVALVPGTALAQTSALFAAAVLALPLGAQALLGRVAALRRRQRRGRRLGALLLLAGAAATALLWLVFSWFAGASGLRDQDWVANTGWAEALRQALTFSVAGSAAFPRPAAPALAVLVGLGVVVALLRPGWRWLAVAHALAITLYVFAWGVDSPLSQDLTAFWYNDGYRLVPLLAMTGVPLVVLGLWQVCDLVVSSAVAVLPSAAPGGRGAALARVAGTRRARLAGCVVVVLGVLAVARGPYVQHGYDTLAENYASTDAGVSDLLDADERALIDRVPDEVPAGTAVAGNPWNGSALVWALADRPTPFTHLQIRFDPERTEVAQHLSAAATDPDVCPAVRALGVGYVLDLGTRYLWGRDSGPEEGRRDLMYPGLEGLADAPGFRLVDQQGDARLYEITAC